MFRKIIFVSILILVLFAGCSKENFEENNSINNLNLSDEQELFNCSKNQDLFQNNSDFFVENDYVTWCQDCLEKNGKPLINRKGNVFCNIKTSDFNKKCNDSLNCEGYCIAKNKDDDFGFCSEYKLLDNGCGWLEVIDGTITELCVD